MKAKFALVVSNFNREITEKLWQGTHTRLIESGIEEENITTIRVPGAVEIPFTAQQLAKSKMYQAIICLGCVIRGDTDHYDYVCQQVSLGCQRVMLDYEIPVIFGVLTLNTQEQGAERTGGKEGHKGIEAADAALMMIRVVDEIAVSAA